MLIPALLKILWKEMEKIDEALRNPASLGEVYRESKGILTSPYVEINNPDLCCVFNQLNLGNEYCSAYSSLLGKGKVGSAYLLEFEDGRRAVYKASSVDDPFSIISDPPVSVKKVESLLSNKPRCQFPDLTSMKYIGMDEFTNEIFVGRAASNILRDAGLFNSVSYLAVGLCGKSPKDVNIPRDNLPNNNLPSSGQILKDKEMVGLIFQDFADLDTLDKFNPSGPGDILVILAQVISNIHLLQKEAQFNHNDLKLANVFLSSKPSELLYGNINIGCPFTCLIGDFGKSSISIKGNQGTYRIYNRTWLSRAYLYFSSFDPQISSTKVKVIDNTPKEIRDIQGEEIIPPSAKPLSSRREQGLLISSNPLTERQPLGSPLNPASDILTSSRSRRISEIVLTKSSQAQVTYPEQDLNIDYYVIDNLFKAQTYAYSRHMGIPFYLTYDTYTFLISMMMSPSYRNIIFNDPSLRSGLWDILWVREDDNRRITHKVLNYEGDSKYGEIVNVLKGARLDCDMTTRLLNSIFSLIQTFQ